MISISSVPILRSAKINCIKGDACKHQTISEFDFHLFEKDERANLLSSHSKVLVDIQDNVTEGSWVISNNLSDVESDRALLIDRLIIEFEVINIVIDLSNKWLRRNIHVEVDLIQSEVSH